MGSSMVTSRWKRLFGFDTPWVTHIKKAVTEFDQNAQAEVWNNLSIYKVPQYMKTGDSYGVAYKPQMVSIGPYHFDEEHLKPMEEHKLRALINLLKETKKTLADFLNSLTDILPKLKNSYEQLDKGRWPDGDFGHLMVLDGCFVVEMFRNKFSNYDISDPIFSKERQPTIIEYIKRDMLLMENQLPLLVLEKFMVIIANATGVPESDINSELRSLMLKFYFPDKTPTYTGGSIHMLDMVRKSMVPNPTRNPVPQEPVGTSQFSHCLMNICPVVYKSKKIENSSYHGINSKKTIGHNRSAMVLRQAGINFERKLIVLWQDGNFERKWSDNLRDITFENGSLYLPTITIEHNSESMFLNFITYEQLHLEQGRFISSYFIFMYGLITSADDVGLLRDKEIIKSSISCDNTIRDVITKLAKGLSFGKDDDLFKLQQKLNNYYMVSKDKCQRKMDRWYLKMCDTYFESPWSMIKLFSGIVLLTTTIVSTTYAIISYKHGR